MQLFFDICFPFCFLHVKKKNLNNVCRAMVYPSFSQVYTFNFFLKYCGSSGKCKTIQIQIKHLPAAPQAGCVKLLCSQCMWPILLCWHQLQRSTCWHAVHWTCRGHDWVLIFLSSYLLLQNGFCSSSVINRAGQKSHLMCWYKRTVFRLIHTFTRDYCVHTNLDKWLQPLLCLLDFSFLSDTTSCQLAHKFCNYTNN